MEDDVPPPQEGRNKDFNGSPAPDGFEGLTTGLWKWITILLIVLSVVGFVFLIFGAIYSGFLGHTIALGVLIIICMCPLGFFSAWKHSKYLFVLYNVCVFLFGLWSFAEFIVGCVYTGRGFGAGAVMIIFGIAGTASAIGTLFFGFKIWQQQDFSVEWL